jgi:Peptidase family M23
MSTLSAHLSRGVQPRKLVVLGVALVAILVAASLAAPRASAAGTGYQWPVKPFDRPHPVRANFGDPRTTFFGPPTQRGLMSSDGVFAFHFGVDIAVPDGTAVYPVRSGAASVRGLTVIVDSGDGFATEYWHIVPTVTNGQKVIAYETVLGHVLKGYEHVHFTEDDHGRPVNPLAPGHLGPYDDTTAPIVHSISFRQSEIGPDLLPESVHGRVVLIAHAYDMPAEPVPGDWNDLPVAPALLTWRLERCKDARVVVRERTAFDVRTTLPPNPSFWQHYARGTRQNMATFDRQRAWMEPGTYLYKLTPRPFDTTSLPNGIYRLVVTVADIRGNASSVRQVFIVRNSRSV